MAMRGDGDDWRIASSHDRQIASSHDRQIASARGEGGFGLACAGSAMTGESSRSRWPGVVKATAGRSPAHAARATPGKSPAHAASVRMPASARTGKLPARGEGEGGGGAATASCVPAATTAAAVWPRGGVRAWLGTPHGM